MPASCLNGAAAQPARVADAASRRVNRRDFGRWLGLKCLLGQSTGAANAQGVGPRSVSDEATSSQASLRQPIFTAILLPIPVKEIESEQVLLKEVAMGQFLVHGRVRSTGSHA